jgi:hypothetical protein
LSDSRDVLQPLKQRKHMLTAIGCKLHADPSRFQSSAKYQTDGAARRIS